MLIGQSHRHARLFAPPTSAVARFTDSLYFGEEVDIYKDGKIAEHSGAWISGEKGARFGLALPGKPVVGDRYYQELAPGVAMDRAEIIDTAETIRTPAGVFHHCVHVRETTPLERGTSDKWYAPGIGLIKDDHAVLISHTPAAK